MGELKVFTVAQVAEMLHCTEQTVVNYIKSGKLGAFVMGRDYRITEKDLYNYVEAFRKKVE